MFMSLHGRHFLRLHDGTIIELFGEMETQFGVAHGAMQDMLRKMTNADGGHFGSDRVLFPAMS